MFKHYLANQRAKQFAAASNLKLQLGSGANVKEGWVNIDLDEQADLTLDLRERMPFRDHSCILIYSEHLLEHISYPDGVDSLLGECFRILQPGGVFSVGVPDTEWPLLEYAGKLHEGYFEKAKSQWHPDWCQTEMEHINQHFRQGSEHLFAYDFKTMKHALSKAGFVNITRRGYNPELDTLSRSLGTLYVDAIKP